MAEESARTAGNTLGEDKARELLRCQFHEWFPKFRHCTIKSEIIPIPQPFIDYVLEDGVFLHKSSHAMPPRNAATGNKVYSDSDSEEELLDAGQRLEWDEEEDTTEEPQIPHFPEFETAIRDSIERLGGFVFPKCNWSSPKDAIWLSPTKNLKCENHDQIYLFFKSSDNILHDICYAFDHCFPNPLVDPRSVHGPNDGNGASSSTEGEGNNNSNNAQDSVDGHNDIADKSQSDHFDTNTGYPSSNFFLVLRKWIHIAPESEFRCFIIKKTMVGICQRNVDDTFPFLGEKENQIKETIFQFYHEQIVNHFESMDFVLDVYIKGDKVSVIDFNPYGNPTNPLLFSWEELEQTYSEFKKEEHGNETVNGTVNEKNEENAFENISRSQRIAFRFVKSSHPDATLFPSSRSYYGVPYDLIDMNPGGSIDEFLQRAMNDLDLE